MGIAPALKDRRCPLPVDRTTAGGEGVADDEGAGATVIVGTSPVAVASVVPVAPLVAALALALAPLLLLDDGVGAASYEGRVDNGGLLGNSLGNLVFPVGVIGVGVAVAVSKFGEGLAVVGDLPLWSALSLVGYEGMKRRVKRGMDGSSVSSSSSSSELPSSDSSELMPPSSSKAGPDKWDRSVPMPSVGGAETREGLERLQNSAYTCSKLIVCVPRPLPTLLAGDSGGGMNPSLTFTEPKGCVAARVDKSLRERGLLPSS